MSAGQTEALIADLAGRVGPVRPLAPPRRRAGAFALGLGVPFALLILLWGDPDALLASRGGDPMLTAIEIGAMAVTGLFALFAAFALSIPGAARLWLLPPLFAAAIWIGASGVGCFALMARDGLVAWGSIEQTHCFLFILGASILIGAPLAWLLSRARPIEPLPVAVMGALACAAWSALLLAFFHPFPVTLLDLAFHLLALLLVLAAAATLRRRLLGPA